MVNTALAFDRQRRWQSAQTMREALRSARLTGTPALGRTHLAGTIDDPGYVETVTAVPTGKPL